MLQLEGERPPTPSKGMSVSTGEENSESVDEEAGGVDAHNLQELLPRADIGAQITEQIISELNDKNWKVRDESLQKVARLINGATYISNNLGELPVALAARMSDSNKMICQMAFCICKNLGRALGKYSKSHLRTLLPAMLQGLGDSKVSNV
jgi:cytoskeleton-associated protein 5